MKIKSVEAITVEIPLSITQGHGSRMYSSRFYAIVRVKAGEMEGVAYAITFGGGLLAATIEALIPFVIGRDTTEIPAIWSDLYNEAYLMGRHGLPIKALSAIDNALWDLHAKSVSLPLYKLLGAHRTTLPAYISGGYYRDGYTLDQLQEEFAAFAKAGFYGMKIRVGGADVETDRQRVAAVREAIGPGPKLMVDGNCRWTTVEQARRFLDAVEEYNIRWVEEPFLPESKELYRQLAPLTPIHISLGEGEAAHWPFAEFVRDGSVRVFQPDCTVIGGTTEWLRTAAFLTVMDRVVVPHYYPDMHIHMAATCPAVELVEYVPHDSIINFDAVQSEPIQPKNGTLSPPDRPGFGLTIDWNAVERFRVKS